MASEKLSHYFPERIISQVLVWFHILGGWGCHDSDRTDLVRVSIDWLPSGNWYLAPLLYRSGGRWWIRCWRAFRPL